MDTNTKMKMKLFLSYSKYIALAFLILYVGLLIIPAIGSMVFIDIVGKINPMMPFQLMVVGPSSVSSWLVVTLGTLISKWPFIAFIVWVVLDSRKFKTKEIQTRPYLWGLGMVYPLILVGFPLYLIYRNVIWAREVEKNNAKRASENIKNGEKLKEKRNWVWKICKILFAVFIVLTIGAGLLTQFGSRNKAIADFIVNYALSTSCSSGKSGCDELRPLPKILQNKKIVFNEDTSIQFDPRYRPEIGLTDLDVLGSLNTNHLGFIREDTVDPSLGKLGYLSEREYKIIRAVHHHNCSYCVDSSDYAYIVLEDSKGNRFNSLLDDMDFSTEPARDIPWDEQVPYDVGRSEEFGKLVDIKSVLAQ